MNMVEILLTVLVAVNALAFLYWVHVDSKMTTRIDQLYVELINMKKEAK